MTTRELVAKAARTVVKVGSSSLTSRGQLDPARRNVVEFRHASWWNDEVYAAFEQAGAIFCSSSGPRLPDPVVKTDDDIYVRFHGTERWYRHDYSAEELTDWARRIRAVKAKRVWIYFNNDHDGYAIKNATMLADMLGAHPEKRAAA